MARLLLLQPPLLLHGAWIDYPVFASVGLWQAAAALRAGGHDVDVYDAFCLRTSAAIRESGGMVRLGVPLSGYIDQLPTERPDVIVIGNSPWLRARPAAAELGRLSNVLALRWPDVPLVLADCDVGGMHFIAWDETDLDEIGIGWGQRYEADRVLEPLCRLLAAGERPQRRIVDGIPSGSDLDALPLPAYDLVDFDAWQRFLGRVAAAGLSEETYDPRPPLAAIKTSRGCVYRCNFCTSNAWARAGHEGRDYRLVGTERLGEHLDLLAERYGIDRVVVLDELVNVNPRHFDNLLDALEARNMRADFPNGMRADRLTESQVERLARCSNLLSISAEAATERVANEVIGKRFDLEATVRVARWCKTHGLPLVVHWMIGQPSETRAEIKTTLETAWQVFEETGARPLLQFATPIKGTALHEEVTRRGLWTNREDRDIGPLFQGAPVFEDCDWTARELHIAKQIFDTKLKAFEPKKVIMNTTYICNNQCVFCATGNRLPSHGDVEAQLRFLADKRDAGFRYVDFDGGEPTTNPNLFRLLKTAKTLGYEQINLTTNGRMMWVPKNAEKIAASGITNLLVSLHGPNEAIHEQQVQSKGAFGQTVAGITNAVAATKRHGVGFGVNVTLTKTNHPVLLEYGALLDELGVTMCNIQFVTPFGKASAATQPDPAEAAAAVMKLIDAYGERITFQVINLPICYMRGYEEHCLGDIYKMEREMVFVSMEDVNLFDYLQSRRRHEKPCESCFYSVACEGFYYFPEEWNDEAAARWGD